MLSYSRCLLRAGFLLEYDVHNIFTTVDLPLNVYVLNHYSFEIQLCFVYVELLCRCLSGEKTQLRHSVRPT